MLNELFQAVAALAGTQVEKRHPALNPMGKNQPLLLVALDRAAKPVGVKVIPGEVGGSLLRVCHASQGSSFPGLNLLGPLHQVEDAGVAKEITEILGAKIVPQRLKEKVDVWTSGSPLRRILDDEKKRFQRSTGELVGWLEGDFSGGGSPELRNWTELLRVLKAAPPEPAAFARALAARIAGAVGDLPPREARQAVGWLFGGPEKPGNAAPRIPIYLHLADEDARFPAVADARMGAMINRHLVDVGAAGYSAAARGGSRGNRATRTGPSMPDAYSGLSRTVARVFPAPKVAVLGNVHLFSNNSKESPCLGRYGLNGAEVFPVAEATARRMADILLYLAPESGVGACCRKLATGSARPGLLVAYLDGELDASSAFADLFGSEAETFADPDFSEVTRPILATLDAKIAANPNQLVRLFALGALDKANTQALAHRAWTVGELAGAARRWQEAARAGPAVTARFWDKRERRTALRGPVVPSPAEAAGLLNTVWSAGGSKGLSAARQVAFSAVDALDLFLSPAPIQRARGAFALHLLLSRSLPLFAVFGRYRASQRFNEISDNHRWRALKAASLLRLLLSYAAQFEVSMDHPAYQIGRLLALADSVHFQYCKWVRTPEEKRRGGEVAAPGELLGNSLFNYALDHPEAALARLAERIKPYQAWARTYQGGDAGLVHWLRRQMGACQPELGRLPARMQDRDKAQLLLGYLADAPKQTEPRQEPAETQQGIQ